MFVSFLEYINQIDSGLGGTDVVFLLHFLPCTAVGTRIAVGLEIEVAHADSSLDIPVLTQQPGITIAQADARAPALMTLALSAEDFDIRYIINKVRPTKCPLKASQNQ